MKLNKRKLKVATRQTINTAAGQNVVLVFGVAHQMDGKK